MNVTVLGTLSIIAMVVGIVVIAVAVVNRDDYLWQMLASLIAFNGLLFRRAAEDAGWLSEETRRRCESWSILLAVFVLSLGFLQLRFF